MRDDVIEWDDDKAKANLKKHGVSFETAQYIFSDPDRLERLDRSAGNVFGEERWQVIGKVEDILFVVYTERGTRQRLISARLANKEERRLYNGYCYITDTSWARTR
jgi:uncharacterized DUF497 family protein